MKSFLKFILNPFYKAEKIFSNRSEGGFYWKNVKKQFLQNKPGIYSLRFLYCMVFVALFADFLAGEKPLIAKYNGSFYLPAFRSYAVELGIAKWQKDFLNADWKNLKYEWAVFPLVPYSPQEMDNRNVHSVSPFGTQNVSSLRWRHWLGTDELGRDVLSGMIHGTRIALTVGIVAMGIAAMLGIFIGGIAGYFGDERLKLSRAGIFLNIIFFVLGIFYGFGVRSYILLDALTNSFGIFLWEMFLSFLIFCFVLAIGNALAVPLSRISFLKKKINVPVDILLSRLIEIVVSIPTLFLIISVSAIVSHPSLYIVMAIIGLTSWTGIARFIRAEMLRIRSLEYIESARALGFSEWRILLRHAIPNALSPVLIAIAFGIAASILIESTLSFLGVGVPPETVTWGSLLASARQSPSAWWLALIPGCAIFITVTVFNLIGEALTDAIDPKQKK